MQPKHTGLRSGLVSFELEHLFGWLVTIGLCLVPVVMWFQMHPPDTIRSLPALMLSIGRVAGLVGMVMYALNLVYSTRLRFLEYFFGGLNRVYIAHHLLGGFALIFLTLHPLFLALRYIGGQMLQGALLLLPNGSTPISALFDRSHEFHELVLTQWAITFGIMAFWGMVVLLLVTFFINLPYRLWLFTHKFLGAAFFLGSLHVLFIESDTSNNPALKYYLLTLAATGLGAYVYRTLMGSIIIKHYKYVVDSVKVVAGNVVQVNMVPTGLKMSYKPGQFVFVRFNSNTPHDGISKEWHPFSISSAPHDGVLQLSVKGLGDYTNKLAVLRAGSTADIEGAYGRFTYTNFKNKNQIWVAGGIGVTPFISMARSIMDPSFHVDLYYSVNTTSELIDWDLLAGVAGGNPNFRVIPFIGDQQNGAFLSASFIKQYSGGLKGKEVFICGPPPMMKSMRQQFKNEGLPGTSIHSEEFAMS